MFKRKREVPAVNIYQKICLVIGALVIAAILMNPVMATKEVANPAYNPKLLFGGEPTQKIQYVDYGATTSSAVGAAVVTGALIILLGYIKPKDTQ